jgi:hypothetical protein
MPTQGVKCDIFFAESEDFIRKPDERIENRAPSNLIVVERVVKMARADGVFGQDQRAVAKVPDGKRPISDEFGEAIGAPLFEGHCDDRDVRGTIGQGIAQIGDELSTIVQAAVPSDHGSGRRNMRLLLVMRFLRGVEGAIEDPYAALGIGFITIGAIWSESRADSFNVVLGGRLAFEIPSSKLDAHVVTFSQNLQPVV